MSSLFSILHEQNTPEFVSLHIAPYADRSTLSLLRCSYMMDLLNIAVINLQQLVCHFLAKEVLVTGGLFAGKGTVSSKIICEP